jgi:hypothetical protein
MLNKKPDGRIGQYIITKVGSIDFEGDTIVDPQVTLNEITVLPDGVYLLIPTAQLKGNMVVQALEPKSMLGLVTYEKYAHLLKAGQPFPVLRLMK